MKYSVQRHAILLAALLQVLPIVRNFLANPATANTFAFILKWSVGGAAAVGAYDACSGATAPIFVTATNYSGTVGVYFTNNIVVTNVPGDPGAFFNLFNLSETTFALFISNNVATNVCMPPGLTFKCLDVSGQKYFTGSIYGTPTTAVTNFFVHFQAGYKGQTPVETTNFFTFSPTAAVSQPVITNQPIVGATNLVGTTNNLINVVAGTAPLIYQWYFNTNTAVAGATNATLTLTNLQLANSGYYRCTITNTAGSTNSANALLTVWQPPVITNNPAGVTNVAGGSAGFTVTAGGVPALNYQWFLNATTPQSGGTTASLNLAGLRASQSGNYSVIIANLAGSVTSSPATLLVTNPLPPAAVSPVLSGSQFRFTFNGIPGLTNTILTNSSLSGGTWGVLTNIPPPANSNPITISNALNLPNLYYRLMVTP
jgi:hypothetical protein